MSTTVIDGRAVGACVREQLTHEIARFTERTGRPPGLATILVGGDPASAVYLANKRKACAEVGITAPSNGQPARHQTAPSGYKRKATDGGPAARWP
jgi:methylenetetrahydrofolate dehydrogenase (NADP+)/methenyltetrahydrofolate cyclohydrolase